ncbi:MAG: hypothetical protein Q4F00_01245 [bacterium]|nr:hypothetical protein [bacterium]
MKKFFLRQILTTAVILALLAAAYFADRALTRCPAPDPEEQLQEAELWRSLGSLGKVRKDCWNKIFQLIKIYEKNSDEILDEEAKPRPDNTLQLPVFDIAACRGYYSEAELQYLSRRGQLEKLTDVLDSSYLDDALLVHALFLNNQVYAAELNESRLYRINKNNEEFRRRGFRKLKPEEYISYSNWYKCYCVDNKNTDFLFDDLKTRMLMGDCSLDFAEELYSLQHCAYKMRQGCSEDALHQDYSDVTFYLSSDVLEAAKIKNLAWQKEQGSFLAPLARYASILRSGYINFRLSWHMHLKLYWGMQSIGIKDIRGYLFPLPFTQYQQQYRSSNDRLWDTAHYLTVSTDNFLWTAKFQDVNNKGSAFMETCRIRTLHDKNSPEMQQYRDFYARDLARCRYKLEASKGQKTSALHRAALEMCSSGEAMLSLWDNYREGIVDYKTFAEALKKEEAIFAEKRLAAVQARWNYLSRLYWGRDYYTMLLMYTEGAPEALLEQMVPKNS